MQINIPKDNFNGARELRGLFERLLKQLFWAEKVMAGMINGVIVQASSKDLIALLQSHLQETQGHILRLAEIFTAIGIDIEEQPYDAVQCFIAEAEDFIRNTRQGVVRMPARLLSFKK